MQLKSNRKVFFQTWPCFDVVQAVKDIRPTEP